MRFSDSRAGLRRSCLIRRQYRRRETLLGVWNAVALLRSWIVAWSAKDARLSPTLLHADEVERTEHLRPASYAAGPF